MSASVSGCCIPYQPLPAQEPIVGGGPTTDPNAIAVAQPQTIYIQPPPIVVQQPVVVQAPAPVVAAPAPAPAQDAAAAVQNVQPPQTQPNGGPEAANAGAMQCCGSAQMTPAPNPVAQPDPSAPVQSVLDPNTGQVVTGTVVDPNAPTSSTPPEPQAVPTDDPAAIPSDQSGVGGAWGTAWEHVFRSLGANDAQIERVKSKGLDDKQLAVVAQEIARNPASQGPTDPNNPNAPSGVPATQLPKWPEWQQAFAQLGLSETEIAKIGSRQLNDRQLALVWKGVKDRLAAVVTETVNKPQGASGWSPEWEAKFKELGFDDATIAQIKGAVEQQGLSNEDIQAKYDTLKAEMERNGQLPKAGGWSDEWVNKYKELGVPGRYIEAVAKSATEGQLGDEAIQKSFDHIKGRIDKFKEDGWFDKLKKNGMKEDEIWDLVLAAKEPTKEELGKMNHNLSQKNQPMAKKVAQGVLSMIPGMELAQYATGKHWITGQDIDRKDGLRIAAAALSGLALFGAAKHFKGVGAGLNARKAILAGEGPLASATADAAFGAKLLKTSSWKAYVPFTKFSGDIVALGATDRAARAFYGGGQQALVAKNFTNEADLLDDLFKGVKEGSVQLSGKKNWILPFNFTPWKARVGTTFVPNGDVASRGGQLIVNNPGFRANDNAILAHFANGAGERLAKYSTSLSKAENLRVGGDMMGRVASALDLGTPSLLSKFAKGPADAAREAAVRVTKTPADDAYLGRVFNELAAARSGAPAAAPAASGSAATTQAATGAAKVEQLSMFDDAVGVATPKTEFTTKAIEERVMGATTQSVDDLLRTHFTGISQADRSALLDATIKGGPEQTQAIMYRLHEDLVQNGVIKIIDAVA